MDARTAGIVEDVRRALDALYGARLRGAYLYGSFARGDAREDSDLDILVVLDRMNDASEELDRMSDVGARLSLRHDLTIAFCPVDESDFRNRQTPLLLNVRREGIPV